MDSVSSHVDINTETIPLVISYGNAAERPDKVPSEERRAFPSYQPWTGGDDPQPDSCKEDGERGADVDVGFARQKFISYSYRVILKMAFITFVVAFKIKAMCGFIKISTTFQLKGGGSI